MLAHGSRWTDRLFLTWLVLAVGGPLARADEEQDQKAIAYFANAADYQNAGAFELAAEEWEKLVQQFPGAPQASTAWHHLGICQLQRREPDYPRAIEALRESLKDDKLELREETLINLGWALFAQARLRAEGVAQRKQELQEARARLGEFLKLYPDGAHVDRATFYVGEIDYLLGNRKRAISQFKQFVDDDSLTRSSLRPDALYALAVAHEEEQQAAEAGRRYREFLAEYPGHRLFDEVRLRAAELLRKADKWDEAEQLLLPATAARNPLADLARLRLAHLYALQGRAAESLAGYESLLAEFPASPHRAAAALAAGQLRLQQGSTQEAIAHFRSVHSHPSDQSADSAHWLAVGLMRLDQPAAAAEMLTEAVARFSDDVQLPVLLLDQADALHALPDRSAEARSLYERIATEYPESPAAARAAYNAAIAALEAGQPVVAQQWSERFLSRYPSHPLRSDVAYVAAEALMRQGHHAAAAQAFQRLIDTDVDHGDRQQWKLRLGMAYYLAGQYQQSAAGMESLVASLTDPRQRAEAYFIAGASALYQELLDQAIEQLESSLLSSSDWDNADEVLLLLGEAYQRNQDSPTARQTYARLLRQYPQSRLRGQTQYKLAQLAAAEGEYADAVQRYQAIAADPELSSYHNFANYGVAWCLMQLDRYADAHQALQAVLAKNLTDSLGGEALLAEGVCLRRLDRPAEAVASLRKFLERNPQGTPLANGLYELGLAYTQQRQFELANEMFERVLSEVSDYPVSDQVLFEWAWNLLDQDHAAAAVEKFTLLIDQFPGSARAAEANYLIAQQLYDHGRYPQAIPVYQRAVELARDPELEEKSRYKLGWAQFQAGQLDAAAQSFAAQVDRFPEGRLAVDGIFMQAECDFKQDRFEEAMLGFRRARQSFETLSDKEHVAPQVRTLIYLHGGQSLRELRQWDECEQWLDVVLKQNSDSPYLPVALYELGNCKQNQGKLDEAITHYAEVANNYRNEVAARARFMLGEIYFSRKDFVKAIPEFQRVMYGFGGEKAPVEIKNWQARSAFEAARCSEVLLQNLSGLARQKVVDTTIEFYEFLLEKHASHELASQAQSRLGELQKLR